MGEKLFLDRSAAYTMRSLTGWAATYQAGCPSANGGNSVLRTSESTMGAFNTFSRMTFLEPSLFQGSRGISPHWAHGAAERWRPLRCFPLKS